MLVIDPDEARAALVEEGLQDVRPLEIRRTPDLASAQATLADFTPDVIVIACDSPDRDTLESLRETSVHNPQPIVMFVDRSAPALAEAAVQAGVAAYIVDGLSPKRVRSILEVALTRFQVMQAMRADLAKAKSDLADRKTVDRAKGLLMKERGLEEDAAYRLLRKLAMDSGRSMGAVARELIIYAEILKGSGA